jgi:hypothetical protein
VFLSRVQDHAAGATVTAEEVAKLHGQVRWLLNQLETEATVTEVIGALMYEVVSLVAETAQTKAEAYRAVASFGQVAVEQIDHYGVGKPHP